MATLCSSLILLMLLTSTFCEKRLLLTNDPNALRQELEVLKTTVLAQNAELLTLKSQIATATNGPNASRQELEAQKTELVTLKSQIAMLQKDQTKGNGITYIRWGRKECPNNGTELVYSGFAAGAWYDHAGDASNHLCMPKDPSWLKYTDGTSYQGGFVYGAEYESNFEGPNIFDQDAPCAVCLQPKASVTLMIPGRTTCHGGWNLEYVGYLASAHYNYKRASEYICLDQHPDVLMHGGNNDDGAILRMVEAICGSLPCPPYVNGRELACVVCSK